MNMIRAVRKRTPELFMIAGRGLGGGSMYYAQTAQ